MAVPFSLKMLFVLPVPPDPQLGLGSNFNLYQTNTVQKGRESGDSTSEDTVQSGRESGDSTSEDTVYHGMYSGKILSSQAESQERVQVQIILQTFFSQKEMCWLINK